MLRETISAALVTGLILAPAASSVDTAFDRYWAAADVREAAERAADVVQSGVSFDDAYRRLKAGRVYGPHDSGTVRLSNKTEDGVEHNYAVTIPERYDPSKRYQVRIQLHGGVTIRHSNVPPPNAGGIGPLAGAEQIYIVPFAWDAEAWWTDDQLLNLRAILDRAKRDYNVDENRVVLSGVSDGGTGTYYVAMRDTTPYAAFLPLNGYMMVLGANDLNVDGPLFPNNMKNKPFFIVNGRRDPLFPFKTVEPYVEHYKQGGVALEFHPQDAGHNTSWWPQVKDIYESFVREHPRKPLPDSLTWEAADPSTDGRTGPPHNRAHWAIVDALGTAKDEAGSLPDLNDYVGPPQPDFGVRTSAHKVYRVEPGSNAERLGVKVGDVVMHVNDRTIGMAQDVDDMLKDTAPGTPITLMVARNNEPVEIAGTYEPKLVTKPATQLFDRSQPWGRVDLVRTGNTVKATTHGVTAFTLLLSPDQFDFSKPIVVIANGRKVFDGRAQKDLRTLMKYAALDNDRTMLFGAELHIKL